MNSVIDVIEDRNRDLGGFSVHRALPIAHRKTVGPFIRYPNPEDSVEEAAMPCVLR